MSMLVFCVLILLAAGSEGSGPSPRKPTCSGLSEILACPMNMAPVCGTDENTYANECLLCVQSLKTKTNILIKKDGSC
ncbi:serine peptidase inhibitor, Kazal type 4 [Astyanax mexicanus]|uniref:Putative pancreatic secretory proteinase inhibitor n=1 Tax=Astyanax mexicanus TaxID=7994 RepID=A0A8T2KPN8_ASTMX|nr:serine peptidase inhibitor, Kazal type 4 [Astyanax mexicanus]KAG9259722.1 putative pancreatic secretory proteinase inhibitor [Astyanax mexicanus]